ncbi:MAG TPA: hypothetical protein VHP12_07495 [Chitinophagaceae bacterium]|nr:hypothetical protein [Chitinophagaceae bacterium]
MNWYYWIQENKTKWYGGNVIVAVLILLFVKSSFWIGFAETSLGISVIYFIWLGFQKLKNINNKPDLLSSGKSVEECDASLICLSGIFS